MKEIIMISFAFLSLVLIFITIPKINRLSILRRQKDILLYLTLAVPVAGFIITHIAFRNAKEATS